MKNKKGNINIWVIGLIVIVGIALLANYQQSRVQLKVITDEPINSVCFTNTDSSYTEINCFRTKGQWLNQGLCGFCKCPSKSIGWVRGYGCFYSGSTLGSRGD